MGLEEAVNEAAGECGSGSGDGMAGADADAVGTG